MPHEYTPYWDRGWRNVPDMTGAKAMLDGCDIVDLSKSLGFSLPLKNVLDVGCGTGRLAQHADGYLGCDIAPSAVEYCERKGIKAIVISGPDDMSTTEPEPPYDWITCISVFTHIDILEREIYLERFRALGHNLLVDIIPGDGSGDVARWTADPAYFQQQVLDTGWEIKAVAERFWPGDNIHRYYYCV